MSLARFSWRQVWRGAVIWATVIAILVLAGIRTFDTAYPSETSRLAFAQSIGKLPTFQALYGRATAVDTAGGFITWRYGMFLSVVVGLWALLAVTRMLRGDEETERADLLVAGSVSPRRLMLVELATVGVGCALVMAAAALSGIAGGLPVGGSILFGFMVAAGGVVFGAIASLTSQLVDTRRRAAGWAGAVLGASYVLRALGDGSRHLQWVGWLSPLGWTERIEPLTQANGVAVAVIVVVSALLIGLAAYLREHRDTGVGLVGDRVSRSGPRVMRSALELDWHLSIGGLLAWAIGMLVGLFVMGYLTRDMVTFVAENPSINDMMIRIYGYSLAAPAGFLGVSFALVAMLLAVYAGAQLVSAREEEAAGRADNLLVGGTSRFRWLASRICVAIVAMVVLAVVAAVGAWAGVNVGGSSISLLDAVKGSLNVIPTALLFGGLAVLAFGTIPRLTAYVAFGTVTVSYLVQIVSGLAQAPSWLIDASPFTHIAPVPATPVNTVASLVALAIAVVATTLGLLVFHRRDLAGD